METLSNVPAEALSRFRELVASHDELFVVLGVGPDADAISEEADEQTDPDDDFQLVVVAPNPAAIKSAVKKLPGLTPDMDTPDRAFVTSLAHTITDVIKASEHPGPSGIGWTLRVTAAWNK